MSRNIERDFRYAVLRATEGNVVKPIRVEEEMARFGWPGCRVSIDGNALILDLPVDDLEQVTFSVSEVKPTAPQPDLATELRAILEFAEMRAETVGDVVAVVRERLGEIER